MHANWFLIPNRCWVNADGCTDHESLGAMFCLPQALEEQHVCLHLPGLYIDCVAIAWRLSYSARDKLYWMLDINCTTPGQSSCLRRELTSEARSNEHALCCVSMVCVVAQMATQCINAYHPSQAGRFALSLLWHLVCTHSLAHTVLASKVALSTALLAANRKLRYLTASSTVLFLICGLLDWLFTSKWYSWDMRM